jgi:hypothetical protein
LTHFVFTTITISSCTTMMLLLLLRSSDERSNRSVVITSTSGILFSVGNALHGEASDCVGMTVVNRPHALPSLWLPKLHHVVQSTTGHKATVTALC